MAVAGEITYGGDTVTGEISAIAYEADSTTGRDGWQVGAGIGFALGGVVNVSLAAGVGKDPFNGDYWDASGLISFNLTDTVHAEAGANHKVFEDIGDSEALTSVVAGIYYDPVKQLTFGVEGEVADLPDTGFGFVDDNAKSFDVVSIWRF